MDIRKTLRGALGVVLAAVLAVSLAGCGDNSKEVIAEGLDSMLGAFKDPTVESLEEAVVEPGGTEEDASDLAAQFQNLEDSYGIDADELLSYLFMDYDYAYGDITVDGDSASTTVTLTSKNFEMVSENFSAYASSEECQTAIQELATEYTDYDELMKAVYQLSFSKLYEYIKGADWVTQDVDVEFTKVDDSWEMTDSSSTAITNALFSGLTAVSEAEE